MPADVDLLLTMGRRRTLHVFAAAVVIPPVATGVVALLFGYMLLSIVPKDMRAIVFGLSVLLTVVLSVAGSFRLLIRTVKPTLLPGAGLLLVYLAIETVVLLAVFIAGQAISGG